MRVLEVGQTLDRYTIEALVGEGGVGQVYRAFDTRLRRHVALKVLRLPEADPEDAVADVLREARAAAAIAHPNVTAVLDAGELEGAPSSPWSTCLAPRCAGSSGRAAYPWRGASAGSSTSPLRWPPRIRWA